MIRIVAAPLFALLLLPSWACAQGDAAAAEALAGLQTALKEKHQNDTTHFVGKVVEAWAGASEALRADMVKEVAKVLKSKDRDLRVLGVESLAKLKGGDKDIHTQKATAVLLGEIGQKRTEEDLPYYNTVLSALGELAHPSAIGPLTKLLKYKDIEVVAGASMALGGFRGSDLKDKKEIVKELLKAYTGFANQAKDNRNTTAVTKFGKVESPMETAVKALTGVTGVAGADAWQSWWNNDGKKAKEWPSGR